MPDDWDDFHYDAERAIAENDRRIRRELRRRVISNLVLFLLYLTALSAGLLLGYALAHYQGWL